MAGIKEIADILKSPKALAALAGIGAATQSEDAEAIFGGPKAKMADEFMLSIAGKMRHAGRPPKEIFQKTGWFRAPDGKWKFEIPDSGAQFKTDYEQILNPDLQKPGQAEVFNHDLLYMNYPELKDLPISRVTEADYKRGVRGSFSPPKRITSKDVGKPNPYTGEIITEADLGAPLEPGDLKIDLHSGPKPARSTMLHENQHAVQDIEGWQGGASDQWFNRSESRKHQAKIKKIWDKRLEIMDKRRAIMIKRMEETDPELREQYTHQMDMMQKRLDRLDDRKEALRAEADDHTPYGIYRRVHGEREAQAVQKRDAVERAMAAHRNNPSSPMYGNPNLEMRNVEPVEQGTYDDLDTLLQRPEDSPAYMYHPKIPIKQNLAQSHGEMYAPENPTLSTIGQFLGKIDTPFGNPVGGIADLLQHIGMYGLEGGNKYSQVEPQTGYLDTAKKTGIAALDAVPLVKRALPMAPAIARIYEIAQGQE